VRHSLRDHFLRWVPELAEDMQRVSGRAALNTIVDMRCNVSRRVYINGVRHTAGVELLVEDSNGELVRCFERAYAAEKPAAPVPTMATRLTVMVGGRVGS